MEKYSEKGEIKSTYAIHMKQLHGLRVFSFASTALKNTTHHDYIYHDYCQLTYQLFFQSTDSPSDELNVKNNNQWTPEVRAQHVMFSNCSLCLISSQKEKVLLFYRNTKWRKASKPQTSLLLS